MSEMGPKPNEDKIEDRVTLRITVVEEEKSFLAKARGRWQLARDFILAGCQALRSGEVLIVVPASTFNDTDGPPSDSQA